MAVEKSEIAGPNLIRMQSRLDAASSRASTDASYQPRQRLTADVIPHRPATTEAILGHRSSLLTASWDRGSQDVSRPQRSSIKPEPLISRQRSSSSSSESSQSSTDSGSCYSDDGVSVTTSVAAAVMQAQEERRLSQQSRAAYMRQSITSSVGGQPSQGSHTSSSVAGSQAEFARSTSTGESDCQIDAKTSVSLDGLSSPDVIPTISILPPSRKPVPPADVVSIISRSIDSEPRKSPSGSQVIRASVSAHSLKSPQPRSERVVRKHKPGKITISHPHMNESDALGAQVLPKGTVVGSGNAALFEDARPHKLVHSKSLVSLKSEKPGIPKEKLKKVPKPPFDRHGMPSEEQLKFVSVSAIYKVTWVDE